MRDMPDAPSDEATRPSAVEQLDEIRAQRVKTALSPHGVLALVNTQWITGDPAVAAPVWGVPGLWSPLPGGVSGLRLSATASDGIRVDGELVDGTVLLAGIDAITPSAIAFSDTLSGTVIVNEFGENALRVWDAASDAIRDFGSIEAFPYNPDWVIEAIFAPISGGGEVSVAHLADGGKTRQKSLPGVIRFDKDGQSHELAAFTDGPTLLLVFGDATNGVSTYSVGRFLRVTPADDGTITLDFNRAYLPPCAFSHSFNCPIPPPQNRFTLAINAGERNVLNSRGEPLH